MRPINDSSRNSSVKSASLGFRNNIDLERAFGELRDEMASPFNPHEVTGGSVRSAEDGDVNLFMSPTMRNFTYSPTKAPGLSFYDVFSRRFQNRMRPQNEDGFQHLRMEMKPFPRVDTSTTDGLETNNELMASTSVLNYLNSSANSMRDLVNDRFSTLNDFGSPLKLEIWRVEDYTQNNKSSNNSQKESVGFSIAPLRVNDASEQNEQELQKLRQLFRVLQASFTQGRVGQDDFNALTKFEEELLNALLQRKFQKRLKTKELEMAPDQKLELINEIVNTRSHKRPEECYKFVLTRVIKYLKKLLKDSNQNIKDLESYFYEFYFSETAHDLELPLADFHYPLTGHKGKFKLNSFYFDRIFKSNKFLGRVDFYINNIIEGEYKREIGKKLDSLLFRWDVQLQDANISVEEAEKCIKEYLLKNKRCKLPWTIHEVNESVERFKNLISNYRLK